MNGETSRNPVATINRKQAGTPLAKLLSRRRQRLCKARSTCARRTFSAATRRRLPVSPEFESAQIIHFVGSNSQGFTPFL